MRIGQLDRFVRVEKKSVTRDDDFGSEQITWVKHTESWAQITDITSRMQESTVNDLRLLKRPCKVIMRYDDTITADMRLVLLDRNDRILQIVTNPAEMGRKEGIEFTAEEYDL